MATQTDKRKRQHHVLFTPQVDDALDKYISRYHFNKKRVKTSIIQQAVIELLEKNGITIKKETDA